MKPTRWALAVFVALGSSSLALSAAAEKPGGILRVYHRDNPPSASIHEESTISTVQPFMAVFNNLVVFDQHSKQNRPDAIVPDLARAWSWSEDRTRITFELRDGVTWHDGEPFTSEDVKCTWDTITGKREAGWRKNPRKAWYGNLQKVETNGDHEVAFQLKRPQPSFLTYLAGAFSPVYPCHVSGREMRSNPIGTGPFKVAEFQANQFIRLVRNENYWKEGRPYLDGIDWRIIPSRSTRVLAFAAGEFDLTFTQDITIPLLKDIEAQAPDAYCEVNPSNTQGQLLLNREAPPFDDERIRRAMMLTLDRQAFIDILADGKAKMGGTMLPPPEGVWGMPREQLAELPGYADDVEANREEARRIMRELGYGPDNLLPLKIATRNIQTYRDPAVILIDQLREIYIAGELDVIDTGVWYTRLARKDLSIGWNVMGVGIDDPDVVFYENYSCGSQRNYTNYCSPELQAKIDEQSSTLDPKARQELVWEIDRKLQEDAARPVIYHSQAATCWHSYVKGITLSRNAIYNHWRMEDAWLDK